jgi:plasmid stabilization system protein ParE
LSKANVRTKSTHAPSSVADPVAALIAGAVKHTAPDFSPEATEALQKIFAHNDALPQFGRCGRVSRGEVVAMLNTHFGWLGGEHALENAVKRVFGRKSWGAP